MQLNTSRIKVLQAQDDVVNSMEEASAKELLNTSSERSHCAEFAETERALCPSAMPERRPAFGGACAGFSYTRFHGFVQDSTTREKVAMLIGKWDGAMYYVLRDPTTKSKGCDPMTEALLLWEGTKLVEHIFHAYMCRDYKIGK